MAHIVKRCSRCRRRVPAGARACECGGRVRWLARYIDPEGVERAQTFARQQDAEDFLEGIEASKNDNSFIDPKAGRETLASYWVRWSAREVTVLAPTTFAKYSTIWRLHVEPVLGRHQLAAIKRGSVVAMVKGIPSPWQAAEALKLTRHLLYAAMDDGLLGRNAAARIELPETRRTPIKILSPEQLEAVMSALPARYRAFVGLGAYASLRWSELVAIKRDDLNLEARTVRVNERLAEVAGAWSWGSPKTVGSERTIDLPRVAIAPLAEHLLAFPPLIDQEDPQLEGLVFYGERGGHPVRRHAFRKIWARACTRAGVEGVRVEWLRHSGASLAYAATKDIKATSARLGHTSTRMTDTVYLKLYDEVGRQVADAIDELVRASLARETEH
jgi:integrase